MRHALAEPDLQLFAWEAGHRVLNTLAALRRLLQNDFSGFLDPSARAAVTAFSERIQASESVHRMLGEEPGEPAVDAAAHLARLCYDLCAALLAPRGVRCEMRVESAILPHDVCRSLGLIVAELVTNAARHAFVGRTGGRVWVTLARAEPGWICQVADDGAGLAAPGRRGGVGLKLARALAAALGAGLDIHSDAGGVTATVRLLDPR
jgi:two-component sensor histidine kinase